MFYESTNLNPLYLIKLNEFSSCWLTVCVNHSFSIFVKFICMKTTLSNPGFDVHCFNHDFKKSSINVSSFSSHSVLVASAPANVRCTRSHSVFGKKQSKKKKKTDLSCAEWTVLNRVQEISSGREIVRHVQSDIFTDANKMHRYPWRLQQSHLFQKITTCKSLSASVVGMFTCLSPDWLLASLSMPLIWSARGTTTCCTFRGTQWLLKWAHSQKRILIDSRVFKLRGSASLHSEIWTTVHQFKGSWQGDYPSVTASS